MRYFSLFVIGLALASLILIGTVGSTLVNGVKEKYKAKLLGKNEIPKVKSTAKGSASFKSKKESINWKINITGISNITGANLYLGNNSLNTEPIVNLMKVSNVSKTSTGLLMNGLITTTDLQGPMQGKTLDALKSQMNSSRTFVNILTKDHPGGEIAGPVKLRPQTNPATNTTITSNSTGNLTQVR
jgi:hypothetical protein